MSSPKVHTYWLTNQGEIVRESGLLLKDVPIENFSAKLLCPILASIFGELVKLKPESTPIYIPAVNLMIGSINGYFDYILKRNSDGIIEWTIKDTTETINKKLIRLQPEMEQKLRDETKNFINNDKNCDI